MSYCDYKLWVRIYKNESSDELFVNYELEQNLFWWSRSLRIGTEIDVIWMIPYLVTAQGANPYSSSYEVMCKKWIGTKSVLMRPDMIIAGTEIDVIWMIPYLGTAQGALMYWEWIIIIMSPNLYEQILGWVICYVNRNEIGFDEAKSRELNWF